MADNTSNPAAGQGVTINVRATVIMRIPDLDTNELTALYKMIQEIVAKFGGEFDVTTSPQNPNLPF
jgi:hypothetical protein